MNDLNVYGMYLNELKGIKYFSAEEESELIKKAKEGCKKSRDKIISSALPYVIRVAGTYKPSAVLSKEDLISYGNMGLVMAFDRFQPSEGTRFITYANFWIRKEISDAIKKYTRSIRLPQNCEEALSKVFSVMEELPENMTENEKLSVVSSKLGFKEGFVRNLIASSAHVSSLDEAFDDGDSDSQSLMERISDEKHAGPETYAEFQDLSNKLDEVLENLAPEEKKVLVERTGYDKKGVRSFSSIGKEMGVSKETVRTIERRALNHCKKYASVKNFAIEEYIAA